MQSKNFHQPQAMKIQLKFKEIQSPKKQKFKTRLLKLFQLQRLKQRNQLLTSLKAKIQSRKEKDWLLKK